MPRLFTFLDLHPVGRRKRREIQAKVIVSLGPAREWGHQMGRTLVGVFVSVYIYSIQKVHKDSAAQSGWYEPEKLLMSSFYLVSGSDI